jgi:hypothetical protein
MELWKRSVSRRPVVESMEVLGVGSWANRRSGEVMRCSGLWMSRCWAVFLASSDNGVSLWGCPSAGYFLGGGVGFSEAFFRLRRLYDEVFGSVSIAGPS